MCLATLQRKERRASTAGDADESLSKLGRERVEYAIQRGGPDFAELGERSKGIQELEEQLYGCWAGG